MSVASVLLPVFVQVALTFALLMRLGTVRVGSLNAGETNIRDIALGEPATGRRRPSRSATAQQPVSAPAAVLRAGDPGAVSAQADLLFVVMSWVFVISRIVHAGIHITTNNVTHRFSVYTVGLLVLMLMWMIFAVRILSPLMTPSARLSASIDILADIEARHRPAADALKDWGLSHRFAGSGDRAAHGRPRLRRAAPQGVGRLHDGRREPARQRDRHAASAARARHRGDCEAVRRLALRAARR